VCGTKEYNQEILFALHFDVVLVSDNEFCDMYFQLKNQLLMFVIGYAKRQTQNKL
jgi:hypothetical protein